MYMFSERGVNKNYQDRYQFTFAPLKLSKITIEQKKRSSKRLNAKNERKLQPFTHTKKVV
jgi:hypothetical protein